MQIPYLCSKGNWIPEKSNNLPKLSFTASIYFNIKTLAASIISSRPRMPFADQISSLLLWHPAKPLKEALAHILKSLDSIVLPRSARLIFVACYAPIFIFLTSSYITKKCSLGSHLTDTPWLKGQDHLRCLPELECLKEFPSSSSTRSTWQTVMVWAKGGKIGLRGGAVSHITSHARAGTGKVYGLGAKYDDCWPLLYVYLLCVAVFMLIELLNWSKDHIVLNVRHVHYLDVHLKHL